MIDLFNYLIDNYKLIISIIVALINGFIAIYACVRRFKFFRFENPLSIIKDILVFVERNYSDVGAELKKVIALSLCRSELPKFNDEEISNIIEIMLASPEATHKNLNLEVSYEKKKNFKSKS